MVPQKRQGNDAGEASSAPALALGSEDEAIAGDCVCSTELIQIALFSVKFTVDRFHRTANKILINSDFQCFFVYPKRFIDCSGGTVNVLIGM
jgi:hypothetical protein